VCTIPARSAVKFIRGLICHFGVPNHIITDNDIQFKSGLFRSTAHQPASRSALPQSPIPGAMAKLSVPTPKSSRDSR
jgi:hypothetical protein